jgi:serine/threonine-protein kinase
VAAPEPRVPDAVGPYAILERVSTRAFTAVYRAEQRALGRTVLVLAPKPTLARDSPFAEAIAREAAILGRLDHEGLPRVLDFARSRDAIYLVLDDPRAVPLREILTAIRAAATTPRARVFPGMSTKVEPRADEAPAPPLRGLDLPVALAVTLGAARAVAHAHEHGTVHGGLGVGAVSIAPSGRVVVSDWASAEAKIPELPTVPEAALPSEGAERTTTMAPEQILGERPTASADVWALGALCHELVSGAGPFAGEVLRDEARDGGGDEAREVAHRIRTAAPAPLPPGTPPAVARVIARCLEKDPLDRFPDARALVAAVEDALASASRVPAPVLVTRALAAAGRGEALPVPASGASAPRADASAALDVRGAARGLAVVLALLVAGGAALRTLDDRDGAEGDGITEPSPPSAPRAGGLLRVVARPWAEVFVDGERIDVTPIGRPIPVTAGRHYVSFRHPAAPDEQRSVRVVAGQTVFLDVGMRIDRGDAGAPADAGAPPASP